jgi:outer membrane protein assembly factor BamB
MSRLCWTIFPLFLFGAAVAGGLAWNFAAAKAPNAPKGPDLARLEASRGEWSRWRGPNGDGICLETGLLTEWPEEGPPLAWQAQGFGRGMSSVAIKSGGIFTMGQIDGKTCIVGARVRNGEIAWATPIGDGDAPNCTPTVDGDLVFGLSHRGDLACVRMRDGQIVWSKNFGRDFGGKMMSGWGYSESPLVDGDRVIVTPGGKNALLVALDRKTGRKIWESATPDKLGRKGIDGAGYASVVISHAAGVKQYVTLVGRGIVSVDAVTGKFLWSYNDVANGTANIPTPIVSGDYVFCSSGYGDGGSALLKIVKEGNELRAEEVYYYQANEMQNHHGGMILVGDHIYMGHGHNNGFPLCVEFKTGKEAWRVGRGPGSGSAAIVYADGHLYFRYQNGVMALIEATPTGYNLKGQFKIATKNGESWPHPVIAGGKLYLRDQDVLNCYDVKKK